MGILANSSVTAAPPAGDQANVVLTGTLAATGTSPLFCFYGAFNVSLWGTWSATVVLNRSFDGGTTWLTRTDALGSGSYTANTSFRIAEPEKGVLYQISCTAYTSGTINYRLSATGVQGTSSGVVGL